MLLSNFMQKVAWYLGLQLWLLIAQQKINFLQTRFPQCVYLCPSKCAYLLLSSLHFICRRFEVISHALFSVSVVHCLKRVNLFFSFFFFFQNCVFLVLVIQLCMITEEKRASYSIPCPLPFNNKQNNFIRKRIQFKIHSEKFQIEIQKI